MTIDIKDLQAKYEAATPGEWVSFSEGTDGIVTSDGEIISPEIEGFRNATFIATMHNAWPGILEELEHLEFQYADIIEGLKNAWPEDYQRPIDEADWPDRLGTILATAMKQRDEARAELEQVRAELAAMHAQGCDTAFDGRDQ